MNNEPAERKPQPVTPERIMELPTNFGRNDLCPCGSGKKVKRCHNQAIKDARAFQVYFQNEARRTGHDVATVLKENFG
jgi:hypothetical protein